MTTYGPLNIYEPSIMTTEHQINLNLDVIVTMQQQLIETGSQLLKSWYLTTM